MRRRQAAGLIAAGGLGLVICAPAGAQIPCGYEVSAVIQGPYCRVYGYPPTIPSDLGEAGEVVGYYYVCVIGPNVPFLWTEGSGFVTLDLPAGFNEGYAWGIDDHTGWIVGDMTLQGSNRPTAALWTNPYGVPVDLGTLPGGNYSSASAVSNGVVVGKWGNDITGDPGLQAFRWEDGEMTDLSPELATPQGWARDVGLSGQIVGGMGTSLLLSSHAFLWQDGVADDLGVIPDGFTAQAFALNDAAPVQIVGAGQIEAEGFPFGLSRAFFWADGAMTNLGVLPGYLRSAALDLNDAGVAVGYLWGGIGEAGFIWYDGVLVDLDTLIPPDTGIHIRIAHAINNSGQIACEADIVDNLDTVGLLLTPIETPAADLDGDGAVGVQDLLLLLGTWGPCPEPCPPACAGDLNCDCIVNIRDFLKLLASWG